MLSLSKEARLAEQGSLAFCLSLAPRFRVYSIAPGSFIWVVGIETRPLSLPKCELIHIVTIFRAAVFLYKLNIVKPEIFGIRFN